MKKKQIALAVVLGVCLAAAAGFALVEQGRTMAESWTEKPKTVASDMKFSEICTKNETIIADNDGRYRDYVEIYNAGEDVNLQGCRLTDGRGTGEAFGDEILPAGGYRVCFLGDDVTGFSLGAAGGDSLQLLDENGHILVQVTTMTLQDDQVMVEEHGGYRASYLASPGFANTEDGRKQFLEGSIAEDPRLAVSELLVENSAVMDNGFGEFSDVIELVNVSDEILCLQDFCLSDSPDNRFRYRLPLGNLEPGGLAVIFCDGENTVDQDGRIHANFALGPGEVLTITDRDGSYTTMAVSFPGEDRSLSLTAEGSYETSLPSLGFSNDENGQMQFAQSRMDPDPQLIISEVLLSAAGIPYEGAVRDVVEIQNRSRDTVSTAGWYLSDGGDPRAYGLPNEKLKPGECLTVVCSRETTGFSLSREETLSLLTPENRWASRVSCDLPEPGSLLCMETGVEAVYGIGPVSLGYANDEIGQSQYAKTVQPQGLRLSEAMSANRAYLKGAYGRTADWLELYNGGTEAVNLAEYTLSDDYEEPDRYPLPDITLQPGQYGVVFMAEDSTDLSNLYEVVPCNLSSRGESLYLSKDGQVLDWMVLPELSTDQAYGRAGSTDVYSLLARPTPGNANEEAMAVSASPVAVTPQGVYDQPVTVTLSSPGTIYYTTNSTMPTTSSTVYTGPISLSGTTVIRAIAVENGKAVSPVTDLTYLIGENDELPALCIVVNPSTMFDPTYGMYMTGPNAASESPHIGANYWMDREAPVTVSLFEKDGSGFSESCGLKIFGGYSRALYMKSFSIHFRDAYGVSRLEYPLFGEEGLDSYESFVLRAMGQDLLGARMRDVLSASLIAEQTNVAIQDYRPINVYINERYWGVYFIREKLNENYVSGKYNADREQVDLAVSNGTTSANYQALMQYVYTRDLSQQEHYDYVCSQIDVQNYMDYIIAEIWIGNGDNGNIKFFRTDNMKWTWIMYDTDWGFGGPSVDTVTEHLNPYGTGSGDNFSTGLINGLLKNESFREAFFRRFAWQINNIWTEENINARVDELQNLMAHDLKKDYKRWNRDYNGWLKEVEGVREFARLRTDFVVQHLSGYFGLTKAQMADYGFPVKGG